MANLHILYFEADDDAFGLLQRELRAGGIEADVRRARTDQEFGEQLRASPLDLILAASNGAAGHGLVSLQVAQRSRPDTPFILISGRIDHAESAEALGAGATDFIFKKHLPQIVPAIHRAIGQKKSAAEFPPVSSSSHETEAATAQDGDRYRRFMEENLTGNLIMRPDGGIIACNPEFARIFGFDSVEEACSANFLSLLRSRKDGTELFESVRQGETIETHELELRQRGGDPVYVVARFNGSFSSSGELCEVRGYLFNDTKRKRLEQQLLQAQKMEGLGTLAGGIAHDFNNILAIILGYSTRLENWRTDPSQIPAAVKVIKEAVERGAALVQQLLTSARQTEARFSSVDLNDLIRELEKMLQATFPKTIAFELNLDPSLPRLHADRSQVYQVLLNLCVNARDAMSKGGTITFESSLVSGAQVGEFFTGADSAEYACVRVRDTGSGMSRQVKAHIFEPFYTTKERSKGTGLGLSVVYGVVNNHNGFVQVESDLGKGSVFSIYLPLENVARTVTEGGTHSHGSKPTTAQTILLVEDEEMLRELGVTILEGEGYHVLAAKDGIEAVEIFEANADKIGLVVCDLGLPRLGGRDVFMRMKEQKPDVRAIVASGYLEPNMRSEMLKAGVIDTIQKPYDFRDMVEKIRSIIGAAPAAERQAQLF